MIVDAADRSRSRAMSVVEGSEEVERPPRRTPTLCLMSTVVLDDAQHPGKLPERRVLLDLRPAHAPVMGMTSDQPSGIHPIRVLYGSILGHFEATGCACRVEPTPPGGWD